MRLFESGDFILHSKKHSAWKLECEAITDEEMIVIAQLIAERIQPFVRVMGVSEDPKNPSNMLRRCISDYASDTSRNLLIVDDVFTTGSTMSTVRRRIEQLSVSFPVDNPTYDNIIGAVIFAREPVFDWVTPLFQMSPITKEIE